ncbi:MAG: type II secretion system protein GspM [Candidatus Hydrogenedentota bacterium]
MVNWWNQLSLREQGLAIAAAGLLLGSIIYFVVSPAIDRLERADAQIQRLESELVQYTALLNRRERVDREFAKIAEDHSVEWTAEEIHDGLRREIDRVSLEDPPSPDVVREGGAPGGGGRVVTIDEIPEGQLSDAGEGYREYQIGFRTSPAILSDITVFLRRLQESPQALRVHMLELSRTSPDSNEIVATFEITRTVVDGIPDDVEREAQRLFAADLLENGSFEQWDAGQENFPGWLHVDSEVRASERFVTAGEQSLELEPASAPGRVYQEVEITGGETYEMAFDMAATGPARVRVIDAESDEALEGGVQPSPNERVKRYAARFTAPGDSGAPRRVRAPVLEVLESDAVAYLDNARLVQVR